jgi:thiol:disulfide interchange protein DsbD
VVALQAAGTRVGWGFQFQEPIFVAVVTSVVVLFALNLFGLFEIQFSTGSLSQVGARSTAVTRSFFDGLLCVVLATPCTAPFLGTAVGFAFAGGPASIVSVFLAIGAGLAAPYLLICMVPAWARFVPRPGNWMLRLRSGLGFLLMATAVWLIWIFGHSAGVDGVTRLLALLVVLAFGAWLLGWVQSLALPRASATVVAAMLVVCVAGLDTVRVHAESRGAATTADPATAPGSSEGQSPNWAPYDRLAIERTLENSQPVFVSFTADWCITCKVNERLTLADDRVELALQEMGFKTFRGDWTERDEAIRAELARHGRAGVPLYLVYDPRAPAEPVVLPELLRVETVLESLRAATRGLRSVTQHAGLGG